MNGSLHLYLAIILSATLLVTFVFMGITGGLNIQFDNLADLTIIEISVVVVMIVAAFGTIFTKNNIAAILILGVVGYGVSLLFVIYRAPDLALTQLVIETVTVALFLLCFYHLPKLEVIKDSKRTKLINFTISFGFGTLLTLIGISAHSSNWFDTIAEYFIKTSYTLGGGHNIVNVILVDMRGLDTLFEITVLGIAALAIFSLINIKRKKGAE